MRRCGLHFLLSYQTMQVTLLSPRTATIRAGSSSRTLSVPQRCGFAGVGWLPRPARQAPTFPRKTVFRCHATHVALAPEKRRETMFPSLPSHRPGVFAGSLTRPFTARSRGERCTRTVPGRSTRERTAWRSVERDDCCW